MAWGHSMATGSRAALNRSATRPLKLNEGTVYASLMRLQHRGWISASWGTSENNRKAKFYAITRSGRKQLTTETENWERIVEVMSRLLRTAE